MNKVCMNCKYWTRNEYDNTHFGTCSKTVDISEVGIQIGLNDDIATSSDYDSYKSIIETGQNFGCIHFEEGESK